MKTIGLITYYNSDNYGAMLQAYALKTEIENNGCRCIVVSHDRFSVKHNEMVRNSLKDRVLKSLKYVMFYPHSIRIIIKSKSRIIKYGKNVTKKKLQIFRDNYFPNRTEKFYESTEAIMNNPPICDGYVCGSDQIWSPERFEGAAPFYLDFAPPGRDRIAYAPSIALPHIPKKYWKEYKEYLSRFSCISVREKKGCYAINEATGIMPELVMDPTYLLNASFWKSFAKQIDNLPDNYVFCYFLSKENLLHSEKSINAIADQENCQVIVLPYGNHVVNKRWMGIEGIGPNEFVYLIEHAKCILTDSFHGMSLSIILHKKFNVYSGDNSDSFKNRFDRVENILDITGLQHRKYLTFLDIDKTDVEYDKVEDRLEPYIKKSREYLRDALSHVNEQESI